MNTQLRALCIGVLEASALLALAVVPLLVNFYGFRVFDLPKAAVFLSLALVLALAGLVAALESGFAGARRVARRPLVAGALLLTSATILATAVSVVPRTSLLGSGERAQGLVFLLAALALFGAVAWVARAAERQARIVAAVLAGSVPVAAFALFQAGAVEVVPGEVESAARVFGTLANPIFLGAYLMLLAPLTLARLIAALGARRAPVAFGWALVLVVQAAALVASVSRGPLVGLAAGAVVFLLAWAAVAGRRRLAGGTLAVLVAGLAFVVALNVPSGPLAPMRTLPVIGRFAQIGETTSGSQAARLRIWDAVDRLLVAEPARLVAGHGPEALKYAVLPYAGANIAGRAQADRLADRAHNVLLDALVMTGAPGALALLFVYGAWLFTAAAALGLAPQRRDRAWLGAALAAGTLIGALARLVPGVSVYAAALALLGMVAGLAVYLVRIAFSHARSSALVVPDPLRIALLATGAAAVAEAAFGIQTVVTQVVFWGLAGLVVASAEGDTPEPPEATSPAASRTHSARATAGAGRSGQAGRTVTLTWSAGGAALGVVVGACMGLVVYDLVLHGTPRLPATLPVAAVLVSAVWLAGLLAAADARESVTATALTAVVTAVAYVLLRFVVLAATGDAAVLFAATVLWVVVLALGAGALLRARTVRAPVVSGPTAIVYPILAVLAVTGVFVLAVRPVQADIYFQSAAAMFDASLSGDDPALFQAAEATFARAVAANPDEDVYHLKWGERYTLVGTSSPDLATAAPWFQKAQEQVVIAERIDPRMPYHTFNRGHLQLVFAQLLDVEQRRSVAADAEVALQQAFDKLPSDPQVANELALAKLLRGDESSVTAAVALLEYVRDHLDAENPLTWQLLGRAYAAAGRSTDAEAATQHAIGLGAVAGEDLAALGDLARQRDDLTTAVSYYEQAVQAGAVSWQVWFNLGLLYRDTGRTDEAMNALSRAFQGAPEEEASRVQAAIEDLLEVDIE